MAMPDPRSWAWCLAAWGRALWGEGFRKRFKVVGADRWLGVTLHRASEKSVLLGLSPTGRAAM